MKKIGIVGAGNVGLALATNWQKAGYEIRISARDINSPKTQKALQQLGKTEAFSLPEIKAWAEVILLATPSVAVDAVAAELVDYQGIVIDATNNIRPREDGAPNAWHVFAANGVHKLVKCFNSTGAENMANPNYGGQQLTMLMAGSDTSAKAAAKELALATGFAECLDLGGNEAAPLLESFARVWITLAFQGGEGRNIGWKLLRR